MLGALVERMALNVPPGLREQLVGPRPRATELAGDMGERKAHLVKRVSLSMLVVHKIVSAFGLVDFSTTGLG